MPIKLNKENIFVFLVALAFIFMLIHIEFALSRTYAPENILIRVNSPEGMPESNADCKADIISNQVNGDDKPLNNLESIYDFIDPKTWFSQKGDKGYYLLDTGFKNYEGDFEIKVVCYSPGFSGVSYTIINNTNKNCEVKSNGKLLVC